MGDTIRADAEKYYADMVKENEEFIPILEEERKEAVDRARDSLKDEALTKREDDINKYYNAWIEASSKIPTVEEIVKDLEEAQKIQKDFREQALEMMQIEEIEPTEEEEKAKEYLSSLFEKLIEDVKDVEVEKEESKEESKEEVMDNGLNERLINKAEKPKIDYDSI